MSLTGSLLASAANDLRGGRVDSGDVGLSWQSWLQRRFPTVCTAPFASRHVGLWDWIESLEPGVKPAARVEIWPRAGGKSTTGELACVRLSTTLRRRFGLVISSTQDKADTHIQTIGGWMESAGMQRAVGKYGASKGWNRQQLRTANGFNMASFGLDAGMRGIKIEQYRPDFLWFDDLDELYDSVKTVEKKINIIKKSVLPVGSPDVAILFTQNLIHENSIFSQFVDGRADFLLNREMGAFEPAIRGLEVESVDKGDGGRVWRIRAGEPTWAGQDLAVCEGQINEWGFKAFDEEAQHNVVGGDGYMFNISRLESIAVEDVPDFLSVSLAFDLAATEGGGNHTVGVLMGKAANGTYYVLAVVRGQWSPDRVRACIHLASRHYKAQYFRLQVHLPQDPGQSGKDQALQMATRFLAYNPNIETVSGSKATRAAGLAEDVNKGNVFLVEQDLPDFLADKYLAETGYKPLLDDLSWQNWHRRFKAELKSFRADVKDQVDDQVDAASDSHTELNTVPETPIVTPGYGVGTGWRSR
jgi:phage terminase large subunit-like protein